jgi:phage gp36-like protein
MAYATSSDIEGELKGITFSGTSSVTTTTVGEMLDQESAVIDQYLSTQYVTPVTDADALLTLKKICIDFVSLRIEKVLKHSNDSNDKGFVQEASTVMSYKESLKLLKMFSSGEISLAGATRISGKGRIMSISPDENTTERVFKKDEVQW